ncbi:MAG: Uma2 family endonuclease [Phormidesmis sp.]
MTARTLPSVQPLTIEWERLPEDFVLPDDPVENILQPYLAAALTDALDTAGLITAKQLVASNFGLVATVNQKIVIKAPDWLYVPQVNPAGEVRRSYTPILEGSAVAVVMEFLSETETGEYSTRPIYPYGKLYYYEQILTIPTYVTFDPKTSFLEVRQLPQDAPGNHYVVQSANEQGRYWIPELRLWLGVWHGERLGMVAHWLRWWDEAGNLLLWSSERAEQEHQRAEQEHQRAEQEHQRAEQEHQRAEQLAAKLRELGIEPDV